MAYKTDKKRNDLKNLYIKRNIKQLVRDAEDPLAIISVPLRYTMYEMLEIERKWQQSLTLDSLNGLSKRCLSELDYAQSNT